MQLGVVMHLHTVYIFLIFLLNKPNFLQCIEFVIKTSKGGVEPIFIDCGVFVVV